MTKFIVIASSKGGVGKTTTAINLGSALTSFGREVIVVDGNTSAPNISLYLGAPHIPITLHDVLYNNKKVTDAIYMHTNGLKIIPAKQSVKDIKYPKFEDLERFYKNLIGMAAYVIIDTPAGLTEEALNAIKVGDEVIIVSTPELPAISDALRTVRMAKEHNKKVIGTILTRVYDDELELNKTAVEAILEIPVIGIIPEDELMREAVQMKNPVIYTHPNAPSSMGYKKIAATLLGEKYIESIEKQDTMFDYMLKRLGLK